MKQNEFEDLLIEKLKTKLNTASYNESDGDLIRALLEEVRLKKDSNKRKHFGMQMAIIFLTASMSVVNALILLKTPEIDFLGVLSIVIPALITALLAVQNVKKYQETWLRHQRTYFKYQTETMKYLYRLDKYEEVSEDIREYFKAILQISEGNIGIFEKNMDKKNNK